MVGVKINKILKLSYISITLLLLCIVVTFYITAKHFYSKELLVRLDPVFIGAPKQSKSTELWLIGDSRISQWNIPDSILSPNSYSKLGGDGQTTSQLLFRLDFYFQEYKAKYILIQIGINDLKSIGLFPDRSEEITQQTVKNIIHIIENCKKNGCIPIFTTIIPTGSVEIYRLPFWNDDILPSIKQVNSIVVEYCVRNKIDVIDFHEIIVSHNSKDLNLHKDCLHLNSEGYILLNISLSKFLNNRLIQ